MNRPTLILTLIAFVAFGARAANKELIAKGKTGLIKGFKSRKGSKFDARLKLDESWKAAFDFAD